MTGGDQPRGRMHAPPAAGTAVDARAPEDRRVWMVLLAIALLARVAGIVVFDHFGLATTNTEHWQHAFSLYEGQGFGFNWYGLYKTSTVGSFLPPLYAWILFLALEAAAGSGGAAMILAQALNAVLGTATVYLAGRLAGLTCRDSGGASGRLPTAQTSVHPAWRRWPRRILDRPEYAAALIWAVYPPAIGHAALAHTQTLETFLVALLSFLVLRAALALDPAPLPGASGPATGRRTSLPTGGTSLRTALLAGLTFGLLLLSRPPAGLIWLVWAAVLIPRSPRPGALARAFVLATMVAGLVVAPWTVRNWRVQHQLIPISTNGGFNFYLGNNAESVGGIPALSRFFVRMPEEEKERWRSLTEPQRDRAFYHLGFEYWREDPWRGLYGAGRKLIDFLFFRRYLFAAYPRWLAVVFVGSYLLLFTGFLLGIPRSRSPGRAVGLIAIAATGLTGCIFIVSMRFRATVEPLMAVLAGCAFGRTGRNPRREGPPASPPPA